MSPKEPQDGLIDFKRQIGGPKGFPFAVSLGNKVIAWACDEKTAELLSWSLAMEESLKETQNRGFLALLSSFLTRLETNSQ